MDNVEQPQSLVAQGQAMAKEGKFHEAEALFKQAILLNGADISAYFELAELYRQWRYYRLSLEHYQQLTKLEPSNANYLINLGHLWLIEGSSSEAAGCYLKALNLVPDNIAAIYSLAMVEHKFSDAQIQEIIKHLREPQINYDDKAQLGFILAKHYESQKLWDECFYYLAQASDCIKQQSTYSITDDLRYFERIKQIFSREFFSRHPQSHHIHDQPIFIVGMPRSGSTLVEQILSAHPDVYGSGEILTFGKIIIALNQDSINELKFPEIITQTTIDDLDLYARSYLEYRDEGAKKSLRYTDKYLNNFMHLGLIHLVFPNAKIIHVKREPIANCFACYKTYFGSRHMYSYDLEDLGRYYNGYHNLMAHWHEVLPGLVFDVQYEELVSQQVAVTADILKYCGLSWSESCLAFQDVERPIMTASAMQVRTAIYSSSIEAWKNYATHLQPLMDILKA